MKKLLLILLCLPMIGFGQTDIPKKTNLITITTEDNIDDSFKKMGRLLINKGYELETADKTFHMITTKVKSMKCGFGEPGKVGIFSETVSVRSITFIPKIMLSN